MMAPTARVERMSSPVIILVKSSIVYHYFSYCSVVFLGFVVVWVLVCLLLLVLFSVGCILFQVLSWFVYHPVGLWWASVVAKVV